jgi:hypothetical protein
VGKTCDLDVSSNWLGTKLTTTDHHFALGDIQYQIGGELSVSVLPGRKVRVAGELAVTIGKVYDFDADKKVGPLSLKPLSEAPALGLAKDYIISGQGFSDVAFDLDY